MGLHGNFVDHADIEEWEKRRSIVCDVGPLKAAEVPLPRQVTMQTDNANGHSRVGGVNGLH
jgi:carotenoid cleavage dioxygenase